MAQAQLHNRRRLIFLCNGKALQNGGNKMSARDVPIEPRVQTIQIAPNKRDASPSPNPNGIDAVNLNVDGEQGITMTFVETVEDANDEE